MARYAKHCPAFINPVDKTQYSDYTEIVKVEVCLLKIYSRLVYGYYRSCEALLHDIRLLQENAASYNEAESPIALQARAIVAYFEGLFGGSEKEAQENGELSRDKLKEVDSALKKILAFGYLDKTYSFDESIVNIEPNQTPVKPKIRRYSETNPWIDDHSNRANARLRLRGAHHQPKTQVEEEYESYHYSEEENEELEGDELEAESESPEVNRKRGRGRPKRVENNRSVKPESHQTRSRSRITAQSGFTPSVDTPSRQGLRSRLRNPLQPQTNQIQPEQRPTSRRFSRSSNKTDNTEELEQTNILSRKERLQNRLRRK